VAEDVSTPTSCRFPWGPFLRVMVTGWVESPPAQVTVTGEPAATVEGGNEVKAKTVD